MITYTSDCMSGMSRQSQQQPSKGSMMRLVLLRIQVVSVNVVGWRQICHLPDGPFLVGLWDIFAAQALYLNAARHCRPSGKPKLVQCLAAFKYRGADGC